ncbi:hypothetical protein EDE08_101155 [Bradyrhizobium sp. R2.2-H]|jgi:hypothetical protein|nr:hypothetical protein EDE10_101155 [Bradyrhizobium sp. Y-H1]TCU80460.1 hypothetical protein EDE08_101155 [Bradyrhizobium sp. R2.2-H]
MSLQLQQTRCRPGQARPKRAPIRDDRGVCGCAYAFCAAITLLTAGRSDMRLK